MPSGNLPFEIREYQSSDLNFIRNSYLESFKESDFAQYIPPTPELYYHPQGNLFDKAMDRGKIFVACNPEDQNQILGWILFNPIKEVLDYVYVKEFFRKKGLATAMLKYTKLSEPIKHTHLTNKLVCMVYGKGNKTPYHKPAISSWSKLKWVYQPYSFIGG